MGFAQRNDKKIMILISWRWGHLSMMSAKLVLVLIYSTRTYNIHESSLITLSTFMQTQLSPLVRKSFVSAPYVEMSDTYVQSTVVCLFVIRSSSRWAFPI